MASGEAHSFFTVIGYHAWAASLATRSDIDSMSFELIDPAAPAGDPHDPLKAEERFWRARPPATPSRLSGKRRFR